MSGRQSAACAFAMYLVEQGVSIRQAALRAGVAYSTAWRALRAAAAAQAAQDASYAHVQPKPAFTVQATYRRIGKLKPRTVPADAPLLETSSTILPAPAKS